MDRISGLPFFKLEFDERGGLEDRQQITDLLNHVDGVRPARLAIVSHGWRNSADDATALYTELFTNVATSLRERGAPDAQLPTVVGVYWPSMALPEFAAAPPQATDGGVAAAVHAPSIDPAIIGKQLDALSDAFGGATKLAEAKALLDNLEDRPSDQVEFVKLLRLVAPPTSDASEDNSDRFLSGDPGQLFERLMNPTFGGPRQGGRPDGAAAGLRDALLGAGATVLNSARGALGSAFRLVNYLTFYQMKERAGIVGAGLNQALVRVSRSAPPLPFHLVGHSFGARVVTTAAARGAKLDPCSLSLLQGAYSHNGLAASAEWDGAKDGYFRSIFSEKRVGGPIIATHTANDQAVGVLYPIASRLAGQNASALGDANDPFGGVGRNGVLHVHASEKGPDGPMLPRAGSYAFAQGKTNNLLSDPFIEDHGDVKNEEVANAVAHVILSDKDWVRCSA